MTTSLNITANTTVKTQDGRVLRVSIPVGGTAAGTINDIDSVGGASAANVVVALPTGTTSVIDMTGFIFGVGITVLPGAGQTIVVAWE